MPIKLENYKERLIDKTIDLYLKTFKAIQIVDPSLATALLGLTSGKLINDLNTVGLLFESLIVRDLNVYMYQNKQKLIMKWRFIMEMMK